MIFEDVTERQIEYKWSYVTQLVNEHLASFKAKFDQSIQQIVTLYTFHVIAEIHKNILIGFKLLCDKKWLKYITFCEASNKKNK